MTRNPGSFTTDDELAELRAQLEAMRSEMTAEISSLRSELAHANHGSKGSSSSEQKSAHASSASVPRATVGSRRDLLKKAGIGAAVTAAGVAALSKPAAAANGDPVLLGDGANSATAPTVISGDGTTDTNNNTFTVEDDPFYGSTGAYPATIGAYANSSGTRGNALFAYTEKGESTNVASGYGVVSWAASNARANLLLRSGLNDPRARTSYAHDRNTVVATSGGDLWWCVAAGTPGEWRKVSGPDTAGSFHAITPKRVWDSRFQGGPMSNGQSLTISIKDGRALSSSSVDVPNLVPSGATAISFNLAVVGTSAGGFLAVTPGDAAQFTAASINWHTANSVLNNGTISTVDSSREVTVWCTGSTDFIIDVTGYYL